MSLLHRVEDLQTFLLSVRHQCCYLTETVQDVIGRFPRHASQVCRPEEETVLVARLPAVC